MAVVIAATLAFALTMNSGSRRGAMLARNQGNLQRFASATTAYAADNADLFWGFSWKKGMIDVDFGGGPFDSDLQACAVQAVHILRTKAGRKDMGPINHWFPHIMYSQLPLYDYYPGQGCFDILKVVFNGRDGDLAPEGVKCTVASLVSGRAVSSAVGRCCGQQVAPRVGAGPSGIRQR
jgi:hypothetical protein